MDAIPFSPSNPVGDHLMAVPITTVCTETTAVVARAMVAITIPEPGATRVRSLEVQPVIRTIRRRHHHPHLNHEPIPNRGLSLLCRKLRNRVVFRARVRDGPLPVQQVIRNLSLERGFSKFFVGLRYSVRY